MKSTHNSPRGQVLIIFVFAIVGLVGITGLAIDGASIFSERRHAQNAADTAALAAAVSRVNWIAKNPGQSTDCYGFHTSPIPSDSNTKLPQFCDAVTNALNVADRNGYANANGSGATVDVYSPPLHGYYATCSNGDCDPNNYVEVVISSNISTWFARVVGIPQTHSTVQAIALGETAHVETPFPGDAIVGLNPNVNGPHDMSFQAQSNAMQVTINGGGIFANGTAVDNLGNVTINGGCVTAVDTAAQGFICPDGPSKSYPNPALEIRYPDDILQLLPPVPQCLGTATVDASDTVHPDANAAKSNTGSRVNGFDHVKYLPGLYCVHNIGSNTTSSLDIRATGVTFYMMDSTFSFKFKSSTGSLGASAPVADASNPWTVTYAGTLMFSTVTTPNPYSGSATCPQVIDLRGSSTTPVVGSIMLPGACVSWLGNTGAAAQTKLIAWDVYMNGNSTSTFNYNENDQYKHRYPGQVGIMH